MAGKPERQLKAKLSADKDSVKIIQFGDSGQKLGPAVVKKVHKTDDEWRQQLSPLQYQVTRHEATEEAVQRPVRYSR